MYSHNGTWSIKFWGIYTKKRFLEGRDREGLYRRNSKCPETFRKKTIRSISVSVGKGRGNSIQLA